MIGTPTTDSPAGLGAFPPLLPVELALGINTPKEICEAYSVSRSDFERLVNDPLFQKAFVAAKDALQIEGMSFKFKARLLAEGMLEKAYQVIHDRDTPPNVSADLIKAYVRWAGYDTPAVAGVGGNSFAIQINLGSEKLTLGPAQVETIENAA